MRWLVTALLTMGCGSGVRLVGDGDDVPAHEVESTDADAGEDLAVDTADDASWCGNGRLEFGEECDQGDPDDCLSSCGTLGTRRCVDCAWESCEPPAEECDGVDDDCNGVIDDVVPGIAGCGNGCCDVDEDSCGCPADCGLPPPPARPAPLRPANAARVPSRTPRFAWLAAEGVCGEPTYLLEVDDSCATPGFASCGFPSPEVREHELGGLTHVPDVPLLVSTSVPVGRRYYWRVAACHGSSCSAWSAVRYVDVGMRPLDFNGDGFSDLAVGVPTALGLGFVNVYYGGAAGIDGSAPSPLPNPDSSGAIRLFGAGLAGLGDVDADGYCDLAVITDWNPYAGVVHVYRGGPSGLPTTPQWSVEDPGDGSFARGLSVAGPLDADADGFSELAVGVWTFPRSGSARGPGAVFLYDGRSSWPLSLAVRLDAPTENTDAAFGSTVGPAGDVDGDGYHDLLVGSPHEDGVFPNEGRAYLYRGGVDGPTASPSVVWEAPLREEGGGFGLAAAYGDLDADGYSDVLFTAGGLTSFDPQGAVFAFRGGPTGPATAPWRRFDADGPGVTGSGFGRSMAACDVNGDGYLDLYVGAPGVAPDAVTVSPPGAVFHYRGGVAGPAGAPDGVFWSSLPGLANGRFGQAVACVGDLNGDGFEDLAVGAPGERDGTWAYGHVHVYYGAAAGLPEEPSEVLADPVGREFGAALASR